MRLNNAKSRIIFAVLITLFIASLWGGAFYIDAWLKKNGKCLCGNGPVSESQDASQNQTAAVPSIPAEKKLILAKGIYLTGWSAGNEAGKLDKILDLIDKTELNAVVIDIKDSSGKITFKTNNPLFAEIGSEQAKIRDVKNLIKRLRERGVYAIGRIAVFEDPELAFKKPHLALKNKLSGKPWKNSNGLVWVDPAAKEVWDYNIALAKEGIAAGFDEINFDYIRFPSDGNLSNISYPFWDGKIAKHEVIRSFFEYLHGELKSSGVALSADLFGQTLWQNDGLNIGQRLQDAAPYFDVISPMLYPSHFPEGFYGFQNPAEHPYEIIYQSLIKAQKTLTASSAGVSGPIGEDRKIQGALTTAETTVAEKEPSESNFVSDSDALKKVKIRPWLQDFDMGANYNEKMIRLQKKAVEDAAKQVGQDGAFGWTFWNAANNYTNKAFDPEQKQESGIKN